MKKRLLGFLVLFSFLFSFAGCNDSSSSSSTTANQTGTAAGTQVTSNGISKEKENSKPIQSGSNSTSQSTLQLKCSFLNNPETVIPIADQGAQFWEKAYDNKNGGFYTYINQDGSIDKTKTYKVTFIQSRDAYGFVRAYQLTGKKEYLEYARKALDFMYKNAWDQVNGGWYQEMNADGTLTKKGMEGMNWNDIKCFFNQFYALVGIGAMVDATRNEMDTAWLDKAFAVQNQKLWDSRPGYEGYYDNVSKNWKNPTGKSIGSVMDAFTTHAEIMYLLNSNETNKTRLLKLADNFLYVTKSMDGRKFGFVDNYDVNWKPVSTQSTFNSGYILKPAWCLARAYLVDPKPEYKERAGKLIDMLLQNSAYDKVNGGGFTDVDPSTGKSKAQRKVWWELEQAVTGGITNYYISGDKRYLQMADESMDFYMKHLYDTKYGDVFNDTAADGSDPVTSKGNYWKGAYHSMELLYYTYVYGNLMLHDKPVSLYYSIDAGKKAREIKLQPVALGKNKLVISGVTLDGKEYKDFDGDKAVLKLAAGVGGEFKVTFHTVSEK